MLTAQRIVLDTGVVLALGGGRIDLRDETMDLTLDGKPKKFRLVRIDAPITVKGRLESPKFGVDVGKAAPQLIVGGLLATVVAPLAVILPFVARAWPRTPTAPRWWARWGDRNKLPFLGGEEGAPPRGGKVGGSTPGGFL